MAIIQPAFNLTAQQEAALATGLLVRMGDTLRNPETGKFVAKLVEVNPTAREKALTLIKNVGPQAANIAKHHPVGAVAVGAAAAGAAASAAFYARHKNKQKAKHDEHLEELTEAFNDWLEAAKKGKVTMDHLERIEVKHQIYMQEYPKPNKDARKMTDLIRNTMDTFSRRWQETSDHLPAHPAQEQNLADVINLQKKLLKESA